MLKKLWDKVCMKVAWMLPKRIVMWASIRLMAHATQGEYGHQVVSELRAMDALQRWPV